MAQFQFVVNYDSTWAAVYAGGTVDAVTFSITQASDFPVMPVSGIAVCNQGWYLVNSYNLYYSVACDYSFNTTVNNADLASLAQTNSACFGAGTSTCCVAWIAWILCS